MAVLYSASSASSSSGRTWPRCRRFHSGVPFLVGQAVGRDVIRRQRQGRGQVAAPFRFRLAGAAEDQVERHRPDAPADALHRLRHLRRDVLAIQHPQQMRMKRLRPEADAGDAVIGQDADLVVVERVWVGLDGYSPPGRNGSQRRIDAAIERAEPAQVRRRAAADEQVRTGCGSRSVAISASRASRYSSMRWSWPTAMAKSQ